MQSIDTQRRRALRLWSVVALQPFLLTQCVTTRTDQSLLVVHERAPIATTTQSTTATVTVSVQCAPGQNCATATQNPRISRTGVSSAVVPQEPIEAPRSGTPPSPVSGIFAGLRHACALMANGTVYCWGNNDHGQTGAPDIRADQHRTPRPTLVGGVSDVRSLGLSEHQSCAILRTDGSVRCWGFHGANLASYSRRSFEEQRTVQPVLGLQGMVSISGGQRGTCAVADTGDLRCWDPGVSEPATFRRWRGVRTVFERAFNLCAWLGDDFLRCQPITLYLTRDSGGGPGENFRFRARRPAGFALQENGRSACAWSTDGRVSCAEEASGVESPAAMRPMNGVSDVLEIVAGYAHFCARTRDGAVYCWGNNGAGQLGDGTTVNRNVPVRVERLPEATALAAGSMYNCAIVRDGRVMCWGSNSGGALGGVDQRQDHAADPQEVQW